MSDIKELKNNELKEVAGGSHYANGKTYSDSTYGDMGLLYESGYGQKLEYHPVIVTMGNSCSLSGGATCFNCGHFDKKVLTWYCRRRSEECDWSE